MQSQTEYARNWRQKRRTEGRCAICGGPWPTKNKRQYCNKCATKFSDDRRQRYQRTRAEGQCWGCGQNLTANWKGAYCDPCQAAQRKKANERTRRNKQQVMAAYGGKCACCGESDWRFLTLDHINNDGAEHRQTLPGRGGGSNIYHYLAARGFPNDPPLQVLCWNCNTAKQYYGSCPHQEISGNR